MKILFTGGGSGGHVFPLVAVARELRRLYSGPDLEFYYMGPKDEFGVILLSQEDFKITTITSGKIRRYFDFQNFADVFKIPFGMLQSFFNLLKIRPDLIFSKGGSGSVAVTYCARFLRIPVLIHESDSVPGLSNRVTCKWAKKIFISFPKTEFFDLNKAILTGIPIRKEVLGGNLEDAKRLFGLRLKKPVILFCGGSQGAQAINDFVLNNAGNILAEFEIIHSCGPKNYDDFIKEIETVIPQELIPEFHLQAFLDEQELRSAYAAADIIVSRSGGSSIFEIAAAGKPSILVPLPGSANKHQVKNAYQYAQTGAAYVVEQENLTPNFFMDKIHGLFMDDAKLEEMKQAALSFSKPMAAAAVAREILEFLMPQ